MLDFRNWVCFQFLAGNTGVLMTNTMWIFNCPSHGLETRFFCDKAYQDGYLYHWNIVEYVLKPVETLEQDKVEHLRLMKMTRQYHGHLPA